jgi:hypothetical protein
VLAASIIKASSGSEYGPAVGSRDQGNEMSFGSHDGEGIDCGLLGCDAI